MPAHLKKKCRNLQGQARGGTPRLRYPKRRPRVPQRPSPRRRQWHRQAQPIATKQVAPRLTIQGPTRVRPNGLVRPQAKAASERHRVLSRCTVNDWVSYVVARGPRILEKLRNHGQSGLSGLCRCMPGRAATAGNMTLSVKLITICRRSPAACRGGLRSIACAKYRCGNWPARSTGL